MSTATVHPTPKPVAGRNAFACQAAEIPRLVHGHGFDIVERPRHIKDPFPPGEGGV